MKPQEKQKLLLSNDLVGRIHDELLDANGCDVVEAFEQAVCWIARLETECSALKSQASAGYLRRNTSHLKWTPKTPHVPVDGGKIPEDSGRE